MLNRRCGAVLNPVTNFDSLGAGAQSQPSGRWRRQKLRRFGSMPGFYSLRRPQRQESALPNLSFMILIISLKLMPSWSCKLP